MKKYDPQMHTTEHILNQTMVRMFGCDRSFSMHLEKKKSKCDFYFDHALTEEEERAIEERVNKIISLNLPVTEHYKDMSEAKHLYDISRLPDQPMESIRIVNVGDYDSCMCIGEHVENTAEIGTFKIVSSSYNDGVLRIRFKLKKD
jgi:alanyl-tRNA synthetase